MFEDKRLWFLSVMPLDHYQISMYQKCYNRKVYFCKAFMQQYFETKKELEEAASTMFDKVKSGKVKRILKNIN